MWVRVWVIFVVTLYPIHPVWYIDDMCFCMFAACALAYLMAVCSCLKCHVYLWIWASAWAHFLSLWIYEILCAPSCQHFYTVCFSVHVFNAQGLQAGWPPSTKPFAPVLSNQSLTVGADTGKASPLTGITMLQTRRKTPLIFNALLSGLKGKGTWRNCAAKCVFLCKAHWI